MVMKTAASLCKFSTRKYHDGWVDSANKLNKTPLPGTFKKLPKDIFVDGINGNFRISLQLDWTFFVERLREVIIKVHQRHIASLNYKFRKEKFSMNSQSFASFQLNYLIRVCIFGKELCKLVR